MYAIIIEMMNRYGYWGILFLITIENLFPPIPSEVILTFGGFLTADTQMGIPGVIIFSTIGSMIGAIVLYFVGRFLNKERMRRLAAGKFGQIMHLKIADIDAADDWFIQKGHKAVFFCRFIPIIRSLISIPAGMNGMKMGTFLFYTLAGSLIWNTVLITLGSMVGESWNLVAEIIGRYADITKIILIISGISAVIYFYRVRKNEADTKE